MHKPDLKKWLQPERYEHSLRVEKVAVKLAKHYGLDIEKASIAARLHDCGRYVKGKKLISEAKKFGLKVGDMEKYQPKLLHAKLGSIIARKIFGITNKEILSAIAKHTEGSEKMSLLEKVIYIADHIESGRKFKGINNIKKHVFSNIDQAIVESTGLMINKLLAKGLPISEQTVRTRNYYLGIKNAR